MHSTCANYCFWFLLSIDSRKHSLTEMNLCWMFISTLKSHFHRCFEKWQCLVAELWCPSNHSALIHNLINADSICLFHRQYESFGIYQMVCWYLTVYVNIDNLLRFFKTRLCIRRSTNTVTAFKLHVYSCIDTKYTDEHSFVFCGFCMSPFNIDKASLLVCFLR